MPAMLILGGTSDIARSVALAFARQQWDIFLAGRNKETLTRQAKDIAVRSGRQVDVVQFDAFDTASHKALWEQISQHVDSVFCAVGFLPDQEAAQHDAILAQKALTVNFTGLVPLLSMAADTFELRGKGSIIAVSSVAGDRGRASNYIYGSAKAGLTAFLSGLRQRLAQKNVHVITVLPGFVRTAMTAGLQLPNLLTANPDQVAKDVLNALVKKKCIVYTRWYWRYIMTIIKILPEWLFVRLRGL